MRFNSMLISCFLFASAVLANAHRPQQLNLPERSSDSPPVVSVHNDHWGGAIWAQDPGTFSHVHAIFTVPNMAIADGDESFAYVLVVIDGYESSDSDEYDCPNEAMLALGLKVHAKLDGSPNYIQAIVATSVRAGPNNPEVLDIPISVNDDIELEIIVRNATTAHAFINNLTNDHSADQEVNLSDHPLCGKTAGWIVSDVPDDKTGGFYSLANFGTVIFTGASAGTRGGTGYQPYGATIVRHVGGAQNSRFANMSSTMTFSDGPLWITYLNHE